MDGERGEARKVLVNGKGIDVLAMYLSAILSFPTPNFRFSAIGEMNSLCASKQIKIKSKIKAITIVPLQ